MLFEIGQDWRRRGSAGCMRAGSMRGAVGAGLPEHPRNESHWANRESRSEQGGREHGESGPPILIAPVAIACNGA